MSRAGDHQPVGQGGERGAGRATERGGERGVEKVAEQGGRRGVGRAGDRGGRRAAAARLRPRPPRLRLEVTVNEYNGTVSWRVVSPGRLGRPGRGRAADGRTRPRTSEASIERSRAAALRAAGLGPHAPTRGAAPIPVNPAPVYAVVEASVASLPPEQRQGHLARVSMLRSQVAGDLSRAARMPSSVAARLRPAASPAQLHALSAARTASSSRLAADRAAGGPAAPSRTPSTGAPPAARRHG
ncbi:hypothetical protein [Streptomyces sp. NPDC002520]